MKAYIVSDQHFEFRRSLEGEYFFAVPPSGADIAIVAGDWDVVRNLVNFERNMARLCQQFQKVFYVPGNHDYYGSTFPIVDEWLWDLQDRIKNFVLLKTGFVRELPDGRRILGDTMWIPNTDELQKQKLKINDNFKIGMFWHFMPKMHQDFMTWIESELREGDIVVTHHLPSRGSINPLYKDSETNCWFVCDMEALILERKPALWVHGHTHSRCDYQLGETRIICNPVGYPMESGPLPGPLHPFVFEI